MWNDFKADLARHRALGVSWREIVLNPAVWSVAWYRFGRWIYGTSPQLLRFPLKALYQAGAVFLDAFLQVRISVRAQIGPGLLIAHSGGITIHPDAVLGAGCDIAHHVTIGTPGLGRHGVPKLGNHVYVGTGAVLIGAIVIGDAARVAANSLVNRSVAPGATVMGVPAVVVRSGASRRAESELPARTHEHVVHALERGVS